MSSAFNGAKMFEKYVQEKIMCPLVNVVVGIKNVSVQCRLEKVGPKMG